MVEWWDEELRGWGGRVEEVKRVGGSVGVCERRILVFACGGSMVRPAVEC